MSHAPSILWIVRAGDTAWQRENRLQGSADLPLSPEGRTALISELAQFGPGSTNARVAAIHHPPDEGATETASILGRTIGGRLRATQELAEPDLGLLGGLTMDLFAERFPSRHRQWEDEPLSLVPPEGEAFESARGRLVAAVAKLTKRYRGKEFAVVLHPLALGFARCALASRPGRELWKMLEGRPRLERYLLPADAEERLVTAEA